MSMEIEIVNYIKEARAHGLVDQEIKQNLLDVGWEPGQVEDSFAYAKVADPSPQSQAQTATPAKAQPAPEQSPATAQTPAMPAPALATHSEPPKFSTLTQAAPNVASTPASHLSDTHFAQPKSHKRLVVILSVIVTLVLLGAVGYFAYGYFMPNPEKIMAKFGAQAFSQKIFNVQYDLKLSVEGPQSGSASAQGKLYSNTVDPAKSEFDLGLKVSYNGKDSTGTEQSGSRDFKVMMKDNALYIDLSSIPELSELAEQPLNWIKLDLEAAKNLAGTMGAPGINDKEKQEKLKTDIINIIKASKILKNSKVVGKENISGIATYHIKSDIDKQALTNTIIEVIKVLSKEMGEEPQQKDIDDSKKELAGALDKMGLQPLELWIGQKDSLLYKLVYNVKFDLTDSDVGFVALPLLSPLASARAKSRDAKRIADIRQMASALELYFNDHNGYPAGEGGKPINISPLYIGVQPAAPEVLDGNCTDYYNTYWYSAKGQPTTNNGLVVYPDYELTFCLGANSGGYEAGIAKLTPAGIDDNIACPGKPEECFKSSSPSPNQKSSGEFRLELVYSDYGKTQNITQPENSLDILQLMMNNSMAPITQSQEEFQNLPITTTDPDERRLANIRQLAAALELYYNDTNSYPRSLKDMEPKYINAVPSAPTPPGGSCSEADNIYTYKFLNATNYTLSFCLGVDRSGYSSGKHQLTPAGIN